MINLTFDYALGTYVVLTDEYGTPFKLDIDEVNTIVETLKMDIPEVPIEDDYNWESLRDVLP